VYIANQILAASQSAQKVRVKAPLPVMGPIRNWNDAVYRSFAGNFVKYLTPDAIKCVMKNVGKLPRSLKQRPVRKDGPKRHSIAALVSVMTKTERFTAFNRTLMSVPGKLLREKGARDIDDQKEAQEVILDSLQKWEDLARGQSRTNQKLKSNPFVPELQQALAKYDEIVNTSLSRPFLAGCYTRLSHRNQILNPQIATERALATAENRKPRRISCKLVKVFEYMTEQRAPPMYTDPLIMAGLLTQGTPEDVSHYMATVREAGLYFISEEGRYRASSALLISLRDAGCFARSQDLDNEVERRITFLNEMSGAGRSSPHQSQPGPQSGQQQPNQGAPGGPRRKNKRGRGGRAKSTTG